MAKAAVAAPELLSERLWGALKAEVEALGVEESGGKTRLDAIGTLTRTLEKLLDLRRLEALALAGSDENEKREAERLGRLMLSRLRALDARRVRGELLLPSVPGTGSA